MIVIKKDKLLRDTPEYEKYSDNIAILTKEENEELGIRECNGCCKRKNKK